MNKNSSDEIIKTISACIMDCVSRVVKNLHYDRTYVGIIAEKNGNEYIVKINGGEYIIKSEFNFVIGASIYVLARQNNMSNLIPLVSFDDLDKL